MRIFFSAPRLCAGPGATCRSARFLARRPAGCFSFVDSRLCAGPGATYLSSRFPARRPTGCFSSVDSRTRVQGPAPPAAPPASSPAALPAASASSTPGSLRRCCCAPGPAAPLGPAPHGRCPGRADASVLRMRRLRAGPGATCLSFGSRFPARRRRRQRRHPTYVYPPRHPARLARPPAFRMPL
eukprot:tig00001415_g8678.t1